MAPETDHGARGYTGGDLRYPVRLVIPISYADRLEVQFINTDTSDYYFSAELAIVNRSEFKKGWSRASPAEVPKSA